MKVGREVDLVGRTTTTPVRSAPPAAGDLGRILALQRTAGNRAVAASVAATGPRTTTSATAVQRAPRYLEWRDKGWKLDSPTVIGMWAEDMAVEKLQVGSTTRALQEAPDTVAVIVDAARPRVKRALYDPSRIRGTIGARHDAALVVDMRWSEIAAETTPKIASWYERALRFATQRTPPGTDLELRPAELKRMRTGGRHLQTAFSGRITLEPGKTYGDRTIVDIKGCGDRKSCGKDPTAEIWFYRGLYRNWYYLSTGMVDKYDWLVEEVAAQVARNTKFAAQLFPLLLKVGAFGTGLSSKISLMIASEIVDALAEEGLTSASGGKGRGGLDILRDATFGVFAGHVTNRMFGGTPRGLTPRAEKLVEDAADKAAKVVAHHDAGIVESAIKSGRAQSVEDPLLRSQGFRKQVRVVSDGQEHIWRQNEAGWWCRFSDKCLRVNTLGAGADGAAARFRPNFERDLTNVAGLSKQAIKRAGGKLSVDDIVAKMPKGEPRSTGWIAVGKAVPRQDDEIALHLGSVYGIDDYIRYHIRAPGLGRESYPISLSPTWMNHGANYIETFMRSQFKRGTEIEFNVTRSMFSGEELRPFVERLVRGKDVSILNRLALDRGRVEPFLKEITYDIKVFERAGTSRISHYTVSMRTTPPPTGARIRTAHVTRVR